VRLELTLLTLVLAAAGNQAPSRKSSPPQPEGAHKPAVTASARRPAQRAGVKSSRARKNPSQRSRRRRRPAGQQSPTRERYAEIQQALIARGYLQGPPTGVWGPESVEALRRFQRDNGLEPTGKLNSLTLIALGLGPNHASAANSSDGRRSSGSPP